MELETTTVPGQPYQFPRIGLARGAQWRDVKVTRGPDPLVGLAEQADGVFWRSRSENLQYALEESFSKHTLRSENIQYRSVA